MSGWRFDAPELDDEEPDCEIDSEQYAARGAMVVGGRRRLARIDDRETEREDESKGRMQ